MRQTATNVVELVQKLSAWCQERPIRLCVLFGSQATGKAHEKSDVDLALWLGQPLTSELKLRTVRQLADLVDNEVNVVLVSPELDPVLGFEIIRDGRLVYEKESELWLKERSRLWHAYNDSLPFRRAARKQLREFAREARRGA